MNKITILLSLIVIGLGFGQEGNGTKGESRFALGIIVGLNYAIYYGDYWPEKTVSAPRINIGISSKFRLTSHLSNFCELSYLRLFYKTKWYDYSGDTSFRNDGRITFDNIYFSSEFEIAVLRKRLLIPLVGIGLAGIWPYQGAWDSYHLSYKNVNNCRSLYLSGKLSLELDKYPFSNSIIRLALNGHYCIIKTSFPHVSHPYFLHTGPAISDSIPLRLILFLLLKI